MSTIGKPAITPVCAAAVTPFWTPGMYSRGTEPPTILLANTKPEPRSPGSSTSLIRANWPAPPVCFLWV